MAKFYLKENSAGQYYWILKAANGETMAKCSEYHPNKKTAQDSITWVKKYATNAETIDLT